MFTAERTFRESASIFISVAIERVRLATRLRSKNLSVSFDGLKIAVGVLMGCNRSLSHKIFVSFVI